MLRGMIMLHIIRVDRPAMSMKTDGGSESAKQRAGSKATEFVDDGMLVGLGTGSTAAYAIRELGQGVDQGLDIRGIPTSFQARREAKQAGIPLCSLGDTDRVDVAIDGADQVAAMNLIKGGGAAHTREKIVSSIAEKTVIVVDESKLSSSLNRPIPVEIIPSARGAVARGIRDLGGEVVLRESSGKDGPVVTDNGNLLMDCDFDQIAEPGALRGSLAQIPGIVEHGLFINVADTIIVGSDSGVDIRTK